MQSHQLWAALLVGAAQQKVLKVYEGGSVQEVLVTLYPDQPSQGKDGLPPEQASSAQQTGFAVSVAYQASPDTFLFQTVFPTEKQATQVYDDIVKSAAEADALIRQEKFQEATEATVKFKDKMKANSSQLPSSETVAQ